MEIEEAKAIELLQKFGIKIKQLNKLNEQDRGMIQILFRTLRRKRQVTQAQAGEIIGVVQSEISRFEFGKSNSLLDRKLKPILALMAGWTEALDSKNQQLVRQAVSNRLTKKRDTSKQEIEKHEQTKASLRRKVIEMLTPHLGSPENKDRLKEYLSRYEMLHLIELFGICCLLKEKTTQTPSA